jgi:hypothetical protein
MKILNKRRKVITIALVIGWLLALSPAAKATNAFEPYNITVVSLVGDPVSASPSGPFVPATTAYLAGWEPPRPDGGLSCYAYIEGAYWIWMDDYISSWPDNPLYFLKHFDIPENATNITGTMQITADNFFNFYVNGVDYGGTTPPDIYQWGYIYTYEITNLSPGTNELFIKAWEAGPRSPSGLVYKLIINYDQKIYIGPSGVETPPDDPTHRDDEGYVHKTLPIKVDVVHSLYLNTCEKWLETTPRPPNWCETHQKDELDLGDVSPLFPEGQDGFDLCVKSNDEWIKDVSWTNFTGIPTDDASGKEIPADRMRVELNGQVIPNPFLSEPHTEHESIENIMCYFKPVWCDHAGKYTGAITVSATQI